MWKGLLEICARWAQGRQLCLGSVGLEGGTVVREGVGMFELDF